jgi:hypothetical protein
MITWWPTRRRLAVIAVGTAVLTGAAAAWLGGAAWHVDYAAVYVAVALSALLSPAAITLQVIAGQVLAASVLLRPDGPAPPLLLVPVVAGVVLTAELLGLVARLDTPLRPRPAPELPRMGLSALIGGGVYAAVSLAGGLSGPTGLLAVALGGGACVVLAVVLARGMR